MFEARRRLEAARVMCKAEETRAGNPRLKSYCDIRATVRLFLLLPARSACNPDRDDSIFTRGRSEHMGNNAQNLATSIKTVREIATAADFRFAFLRSDRSGLELLEAKLLRKNGACDAPTRRPSLPQPIARESVMHGGYQRPIPPPEEVVCPSFSADDFLAENGRGRGVRLQRATE